MRTRVIAAGDEALIRGMDGLQRCRHVLLTAHAGWIALGTEKDEVVPHHVASFARMTVGDERVLAGARVDEYHVGIAGHAEGQCLAGADRDHIDLDARRLREAGQQIAQQARVVRARRGREADALRDGCLVAAASGSQAKREDADRGNEVTQVHAPESIRAVAAPSACAQGGPRPTAGGLLSRYSASSTFRAQNLKLGILP